LDDIEPIGSSHSAVDSALVMGLKLSHNLMINRSSKFRTGAYCPAIGVSGPLIFTLLAISLTGLAARAQPVSPAERSSLDGGWRFVKGDPPGVEGKLNYSDIKDWLEASGAEFTTNVAPAAKTRPSGDPGGDVSYAQNDADDSQWRSVNLPHDWGIEGPFKQEYPGETGKLPWWGVGWYRKHLEIPASDQGRRVYLDVDGAMAYATVWLNGHFMGGWPYGYASWRVDLTPGLKFGADNVIAIRLDNPKNSSRWYPGGGIYRNVWLVKTAPIHVAQWGVYVTTTNVTPSSVLANLRVRVDNESDADGVVIAKNEIFELGSNGAKGRSVAALAVNSLRIAAHQWTEAVSIVTVQNPRLWSLEKPQRYEVVTSLEQDGKVVDRYETPFGIRTIEFTADNGFLLNGRRVPLNGVCDHHDLGALGAAINISALRRQIQILKEMGCNAIRTSHNPPAPELLDLCDSMGMLVMDESFDCWRKGKARNDYHLLFDDWHEKDWRAELRRDRNHPSIVLWSIGNEIPEQGSAAGAAIAAELTGIAHEEDPTRSTSAACDNLNAGYNGFQNHLDVFGYNYKPHGYAKFHQTNTKQALFGSETASCVSSRGEYFFPVTTNKDGGKADFQMSSYDLYAPPWATPPEWEFTGQDENPSVAGEFVWTGFDYLGEPTPYNRDLSNLANFTDAVDKARLQKELDELGHIPTPSRSSYFGILDLAGLKKDRFYLYQARWRPELRMAHLLPHWTWPERVGQVTPVHVYTSGDEAELFLNGRSLGRKKKPRLEYRLHWDDVLYQPGTLKVVAYKDGHKWATDTVTTSGAPEKLLLQTDRNRIQADGQDLAYVTVTVADKHGVMAPRASNRIVFVLDGPGEIVATDNGDATSFEPFQSPERNLFNGMAVAIVRSKLGQPGVLRLTAKSGGLKEATVKITSR
jgi:beta-galactosidase